MDSVPLHRTLVVANRTASTPLLLQEVERRAAARPTAFALLIPTAASKAVDWTLETALESLRRAARGADGRGADGRREARVDGVAGGPDAFESIKQVLANRDYDDVIISTLQGEPPNGSGETSLAESRS
jgi:hypothetical protein